MKLRFIAIGISAAVMLSAAACSKKDAGATAAAPETFTESVAEDVSKAAAEYALEDGSEAEAEEGSIGTNDTDTASSNEVAIEIVTGKNIQQTLAAGDTKDKAVSETIEKEQTTAMPHFRRSRSASPTE